MTLRKLLDADSEENNDIDDTQCDDNNLSFDSNACIQNVPNREKLNFFVTYRGKPTETLAHKSKKN